MTLRCFSYGGGVQSTAALVLAVQGKIDFSIFLFANVGDDSEHPDTLQYVTDHAKPYAAAHGIELHELRYTKRDGSQPTLYGEVVRRDNKSVDIPMRMGGSGAPGNRSCTEDFKIVVIDRWMKKHGAHKTTPGIVGIGISVDEFKRMRSDDPRYPFKVKEYPLIDLRLTRQDCINIIASAGLPVPPKSSCWFCPFHSPAEWTRLRQERPDLFARSAEMEQIANEKLIALGRTPAYLTRFLIPLEQAIGNQAMMDFDDDTCESGYCMT